LAGVDPDWLVTEDVGGLVALDGGVDGDEVCVEVCVEGFVDDDVEVEVDVEVDELVVLDVVVVLLELVVEEDEEVSLLLVGADVEFDDDGGTTTVGDPSPPVTVTVSVSGSPGDVGLVSAGDVAVADLLVFRGLLELVNVHTSPADASNTAANAAPKSTCGRRYHGSGGAWGSAAGEGGMNSIGGRAASGSITSVPVPGAGLT
jgi:hypothetical protein